MVLETSGFGTEFDAELIGGPFDGTEDIVINMESEYPPRHIFKIIGKEA